MCNLNKHISVFVSKVNYHDMFHSYHYIFNGETLEKVSKDALILETKSNNTMK